MEPITIAALVAMAASAYMQKQATDEAQQRANSEIQRSLENQRMLQTEAENRAMDSAKKFAPDERIASQSKIQSDINTELIAPVEQSHAIASNKSGTTGNVSGDYNRAKTESDLNVLKSSRDLAKIMSKISAGNRLRMNEGVNLMDTGRDIDMLNNFSKGQQGADNVAIQKAGQINANKVFAGQLLGALGSAGMIHGATSAAAAGKAGSTGASGFGLKTSGSGIGLNAARTGGWGLSSASPAATSGLGLGSSSLNMLPIGALSSYQRR